jgi:hypothetical protein
VTNRRWTIRGDRKTEASLDAVAEDLANTIARLPYADDVRCAAIIGGYGRGEGGVERSDGIAKPHNNIDLLVITEPGRAQHAAIEDRVRRAAKSIATSHRLTIDVGVVSARHLLTAPRRVMWCDVRFGHQVIFGDRAFLSGLRRHTPEDIEAGDIVDLVTNRGALAVTTKALMRCGPMSEWRKRTAVRGMMKAIVGFGDALLWAEGRYVTSYVSKRKRLNDSRLATSSFRSLFDRAIDFRFEPDYSAFSDDLWPWVRHCCRQLEIAHRNFAHSLLGHPPPWHSYPGALLRFCQRDRNLHEWARTIRSPWRPAPGNRRLMDPRLHWLCRLSPPQKVLAAALPAALYDGVSEQALQFARSVLLQPNAPLESAFVYTWGHHCDPNFPARLSRELGFGAREAA